MIKHVPIATALIALASGAAVGRDGPSFRFAFQQANYFLAVGESVSVPVYLEEVVTGSTPSLFVAEAGVSSVGVRLFRAGNVPPNPAVFSGTGGVGPNTFDFFPPGDPLLPPVISVTPSEARLLEFARNSGVTGNVFAPGIRRVFLGNFAVTAGTVPGQITTFQSGDYAPTQDTVTWAHLLVLDEAPYGIGPSFFTITAIPTACYANCDQSTTLPVLSINDFTCFASRFAAGDVYANCDASTLVPVLNVNDFTCFLNRYAVGCP